jgi:hypothetical protein
MSIHISILRAPFTYLSILRSFSLVTVWLIGFCRKNIGAKAAHKILMKLTASCENREK